MNLAILGLGNIGGRYEETRHNLGFMVVRSILAREKLALHREEGLYDWAVWNSGSHQTVLGMPRTYMNRSGLAATALLTKYDLTPDRLVVIVDDFSLPLGRIRLRKSGSDGGHNGLASIIEELGTENFARIRMGIGPLPENQAAVDFVLNEFGKGERESALKMITIASEAVSFIIEQSLDLAMTKYNVNPA